MVLPDDHLQVVTVLGTRPEIIKCSPVIPLFDEAFHHTLVHTGQHYDDNMDGSFFRELGLREPDFALGVGSVSHNAQLAQMMLGLEPVLQERRPDWVVVQGDTNSTLAGGLAAAKLGIPVAHIEAGCRSFNRAMPEEINRVVVDHLSEICFAPDEIAVENLMNEGIGAENVELVGSTGIDACLRMSELVRGEALDSAYGVEAGEFLVATIHRAENTEPERLAGLVRALDELSDTWPVLFPVHPRTAGVLWDLNIPNKVIQLEPVGYREMMTLLRNCRALLTDSGGLQEEAAVMGTPTFILRDETEWMAFVEAGHHQLVGTDRDEIVDAVRRVLVGGAQERKMREPIGRERAGAAMRVRDALAGRLESRKSLAIGIDTAKIA